ncbi:PREDICTED: RING finger protein 186 [Tinamus guttatus]|uniref:RING finger protein 186 n=1 Tax=Tinamus guttatus TaxID=94827 RepID=UPI00052ECA7C|nr:PREDICTED: RING finger protein 186 [Tinamus guttatus]
MRTTRTQQHIRGARNSASRSAKGRQTALKLIPMEKSTDRADNKNESTTPGLPQLGNGSPKATTECASGMSTAAALIENAEDVKRLGLAEEHAKEMERLPGTELDSPGGFKPAASERDSPNSEPPMTVMNSSISPGVFSSERRLPKASLADMDCLVCFNRYNIYRVPKLLACQHAFCAVCLKLILRKDDKTWIITCPLCRKETVVLGGLIRTLHNKDDIMEHLENPDLTLEMYISPTGLDSKSWTQTSQETLLREQNTPADNRLAIQRLVLLLLLLVILTILILPFLYSGLIKWVICLMLTLGVIMSLVLCCNPRLYCSCRGNSLASCHKDTNISAIA